MKAVTVPKKKPKPPTGNPKQGNTRKGVPNRRTFEAVEKARIEAENAAAGHSGSGRAEAMKKKLGKDVLEEFMHLFAGMAAAHQPLPDGMAVPPGRKPDEVKFLVYAKLTVDTAKALADFQSPKFKAIMVSAAPDQQPNQPMRTVGGDNVVPLNDPIAMARVYQRLVKGSQ